MPVTFGPAKEHYLTIPGVLPKHYALPEQNEDGQSFVKKCLVCYSIVSSFGETLNDEGNEAEISVTHLGTEDEVMKPTPCQKHQAIFRGFLAYKPKDILETMFFETSRSHGSPFITIEMKSEFPSGQILVHKECERIFLVTKETGSNCTATGEPIDPQWIDAGLPRKWKETCQQEHKDTCGKVSHNFHDIQPQWLIDTQRQCLVKPSKGDSYVALSYVWGGVKSLNTMKSNVIHLQKDLELSVKRTPAPIAQTVRDAMEITGLLGERYLWADSLCIVQDDAQEKHAEIQRMSAIYANASLTIVASGGENASSGLRGFQGITQERKHSQTMISLDGGFQIVTFAPFDRSKVIPYHTRGWTYQEFYFSRRKLILQGGKIIWSCACDNRVEGILTPMETQDIGINNTSYLCVDAPKYIAAIVSDFNTRQLTFPEDILAAFSGFAYALSSTLPGGFVSGLLTFFFDAALLWQPDTEMHRRVPKNSGGKHCLPSWSWAAWTGKIASSSWTGTGQVRDSEILFSPDNRHLVIPLVQWKYHYDISTAKFGIDSEWYSFRQKYRNTLEVCPPGWTRHQTPGVQAPAHSGWTASSYYRHVTMAKNNPGHWYPTPLMQDTQPSNRNMKLAPYISTSTKSCWLYGSERISDKQALISVRDATGLWIGILQLHTFPKNDNDLVGKRLELVEVA
ncbi:Fc.00g032150.m01.CDS01 [Cosmosporella sp. VM-42]